jgi:hypothetical protein
MDFCYEDLKCLYVVVSVRAMVYAWGEFSSKKSSTKFCVDIKTHYNWGSFAVTAKSARKRARYLAGRGGGGETAIFLTSDGCWLATTSAERPRVNTTYVRPKLSPLSVPLLFCRVFFS